MTRFTRFALESHIGVISFSHTGNGDPDTVEHGSDFYNDVFSRREYQACTGTWGEWAEWSNCDRSCFDGIRIRERECSEGENAAEGIEVGSNDSLASEIQALDEE